MLSNGRFVLLARLILHRYPTLDPLRPLADQIDDGEFGALVVKVEKWPAKQTVESLFGPELERLQ